MARRAAYREFYAAVMSDDVSQIRKFESEVPPDVIEMAIDVAAIRGKSAAVCHLLHFMLDPKCINKVMISAIRWRDRKIIHTIARNVPKRQLQIYLLDMLTAGVFDIANEIVTQYHLPLNCIEHGEYCLHRDMVDGHILDGFEWLQERLPQSLHSFAK